MAQRNGIAVDGITLWLLGGVARLRGEAASPGAEFRVVFLAAAAAVAVTALIVSGDADTADPFNAEQALRYITFLAIGYMISRGLAKAGGPRRDTGNR